VHPRKDRASSVYVENTIHGQLRIDSRVPLFNITQYTRFSDHDFHEHIELRVDDDRTQAKYRSNTKRQRRRVKGEQALDHVCARDDSEAGSEARVLQWRGTCSNRLKLVSWGSLQYRGRSKLSKPLWLLPLRHMGVCSQPQALVDVKAWLTNCSLSKMNGQRARNARLSPRERSETIVAR